MNRKKKRTTVSFDSKLHHALQSKAEETGQSVSSYINEAVRNELLADEEDLKIFKKRENESTVSYDQMVRSLRNVDKI